jgi:hypothetical protein
MNKTSAQILREHMDAINGIVAAPAAAPVQRVSAPSYDTYLEIANPMPSGDPEGDADIEVGINYSIYGKEAPATFDSPAEYPEMENIEVFNVATGQDITSLISDSTMKAIEQRCWNDYANKEDDFDEPEPDFDDTRADYRYDPMSRYD